MHGLDARRRFAAVVSGIVAGLFTDAHTASAAEAEYVGPIQGGWFLPSHWNTGALPTTQDHATMSVLVMISGPGAVADELVAVNGGGYVLPAGVGATLSTADQSIYSMPGLPISAVQQYGGHITTSGLRVGHGGAGQFFQYGGHMEANTLYVGATDDLPPNQVLGCNGLYVMQDGLLEAGTLKLANFYNNVGVFRQFGGVATIGFVQIGKTYNRTPGRVEVFGGTLDAATATLGDKYGGAGEILVDGAGIITIAGNVRAGDDEDAYGAIEVSHGGKFTCATAQLGAAKEGSGVLSIHGPGSKLTVTGNLTGGLDGLGAYATIDIASGGALKTGNAWLGNLCDNNPFPCAGRVTIQGHDSRWISSGIIELRGAAGNTQFFEPSHLTLLDEGRVQANKVKLIRGPLFGNNGTIDGTFVNLGRVAPGELDTPGSFGVLIFTGTYVQKGVYSTDPPNPGPTVAGTGKLLIEIGGSAAGTDFDFIYVAGQFRGGGELVVSLVNNFDPPIGSTFDIGSYHDFIAPFDILTLPGFPDNRDMIVEYVTNEDGSGVIRLEITSNCLPDLNGDNVVNSADLLVVVNHWGACPGCGMDLDGDGLVNAHELATVINAWGNCPN